MINKHIEYFLMKQSDTFLKPASEVAVLLNEHNVSHAKLLLSQYQYSKVPVINQAHEFVGILGWTDIINFEMKHDFFYDKSDKTPISEIVNTAVPTIQKDYELKEILHLMVKEPFLPVLKGREFYGIIPRQEILKAFNAFAHNFTKEYEIIERKKD
ncbi:CBS domain-containing protein [Lactococcus hodotermopsidis]|uniref:CBS domain-containing protein n=1 Tax=Pseudolactococcus hodotermopsidis TaxID=2709157 RepID=A0A6A0B917_9LACT|nr:cyclic-di-AMP-binding protein CbpB [Lactococcus hodotermopsidis]GFH41909.1 CBS domain-containing protein [Lactococcus hodotermopsidis]